MKPLASVAFSDLYAHPTWAWYVKKMQARAYMWLIGGEPPEKSKARMTYALAPNSWVVLRLMQFEPKFNANELSFPSDMAERWLKCVEAALPYMADKSRTIVCGPLNEYKPGSLYTMDGVKEFGNFVRMEAEICKGTWERLGVRSMIGNFSVGTPEPEHMIMYRHALQAARAYNGVLGLHQYFQLLSTDEAIWTSERDLLWDSVLSDPSCNVPVMVTETGVEQIWKPEDPQQSKVLQRLTGGNKTAGWRNSEAAWRFRGYDQPIRELFVGELRKLAHAYSKRPRIKSYFVFLSTTEPGWSGYDPEEVMPDLAGWIGDELPTGLTSLDPNRWLDEPQPEPDLPPWELAPGLYRVKSQGLNVRKTPDPDSETNKVHVLKLGDLVEVEEVEGNWARIVTPFDTWVNWRYLDNVVTQKQEDTP